MIKLYFFSHFRPNDTKNPPLIKMGDFEPNLLFLSESQRILEHLLIHLKHFQMNILQLALPRTLPYLLQIYHQYLAHYLILSSGKLLQFIAEFGDFDDVVFIPVINSCSCSIVATISYVDEVFSSEILATVSIRS